MSAILCHFLEPIFFQILTLINPPSHLLGLVVSVEVDEDTDVDGADGGNDAEQGDGGKLVDELESISSQSVSAAI
jgi:hypothetical protein